MKYTYYFVFVISILGISCNKEAFVVEKSFQDSCWAMTDTLSFTIEVIENKDNYTVNFQVSLLEEYLYRNIHLKSIWQSPSNITFDSLITDSFIDKQGNWLYPSDWNNQYTFFLSDSLKLSLKESGTYKFMVIQYMRDDTLCNISHIGINYF